MDFGRLKTFFVCRGVLCGVEVSSAGVLSAEILVPHPDYKVSCACISTYMCTYVGGWKYGHPIFSRRGFSENVLLLPLQKGFRWCNEAAGKCPPLFLFLNVKSGHHERIHRDMVSTKLYTWFWWGIQLAARSLLVFTSRLMRVMKPSCSVWYSLVLAIYIIEKKPSQQLTPESAIDLDSVNKMLQLVTCVYYTVWSHWLQTGRNEEICFPLIHPTVPNLVRASIT